MAYTLDNGRYIVYTKRMIRNNDTKKVNEMRETEMNYDEYLQRAEMYRNERTAVIETLERFGCTNIKVDSLDSTVPMGACWSMTLPNGTKWAGGFGAVRLLIESECKPLRMTRRDVLRLSHDENGKRWTVKNRG